VIEIAAPASLSPHNQIVLPPYHRYNAFMRVYPPRGLNLLEKLEYCSRVAANGCHIWIQSVDRWGYGAAYWEGKRWIAHRLSWTAHNGPIPAGLLVLHRCDNPNCINPDHLWLGTNDDNMADMKAKGRARNGVMAGTYKPKKGHRFSMPQRRKLSWEQVQEIRDSKRTYEQLGRQFGVSDATIWRVKKGKKHFAE
jgi:HNH endonuclease